MLKPNPNSGFNASKWEVVDIPEPPRTGACRYCKHEQWQHRPNEKGSRPCRENLDHNPKCHQVDAVEMLVPRTVLIGACPCMEYVPGDNLAFLEWKEKRGY